MEGNGKDLAATRATLRSFAGRERRKITKGKGDLGAEREEAGVLTEGNEGNEGGVSKAG